MIMREYIECGTCSKHYMIRVQVGLREVQKHNFHCVECKENIEITLEIGKGFSADVNCRFIAEDEAALPYYLSPDFVASDDEIHDKNSFPSFRFMHTLLVAHETNKNSKLISLEDAKNHPAWRVDHLWADLKKAWRLYDASQFVLANRILDRLTIENGIEDSRLAYVQFYVLESIFPPDSSLVDEMAAIKKGNPEEFFRFVEYYQRALKKVNSDSTYSILSDFFAAFTDFTQIALYVKNNFPLPENAKSTSVNFDSVKEFYAKCYEFYAGAICIYTCLNNIKQGRKFDQLASIDLEKYLKTDKAERRKSIENNPVFANASKEFDSSIRNAVYHNWFKLKENKQEIEYRSGGTGKIRVISYSNYLYKSFVLLQQICRLFTLQLVMDTDARKNALVTVKRNDYSE